MQVGDRLELAGNAIEGYAMVVTMVVGVRREKVAFAFARLTSAMMEYATASRAKGAALATRAAAYS